MGSSSIVVVLGPMGGAGGINSDQHGLRFPFSRVLDTKVSQVERASAAPQLPAQTVQAPEYDAVRVRRVVLECVPDAEKGLFAEI